VGVFPLKFSGEGCTTESNFFAIEQLDEKTLCDGIQALDILVLSQLAIM
jgi:hypothetical protein